MIKHNNTNKLKYIQHKLRNNKNKVMIINNNIHKHKIIKLIKLIITITIYNTNIHNYKIHYHNNNIQFIHMFIIHQLIVIKILNN